MQELIKRTFDLCISMFLLIPAFFICLGVVIVYLVVERSNPFFRQVRLGKGEKEFTLYKIRTMRPNAKNVGTHEIDASLVTGVGHVLRRTKLDELPQLLNVIRGDMSLVGPRPALVSQTEVLEARRKRGVFGIRPGITGYAQIQGIDMSEPDLLAAADQTYMNAITFWGDMKIIVLTAIGSGHGDRIRQH